MILVDMSKDLNTKTKITCISKEGEKKVILIYKWIYIYIYI